jgi:tryptophan synthase alpha chain
MNKNSTPAQKNRIHNAFSNGKAFIAFLTAGDPSLARTEEYIISMARAGADLIEIGIPFSDPVAEGEVIQAANARALSAGATLPRIFASVRAVRAQTDVPLVFLTYLNPVFKYGYEKFFSECAASGVDGIIIPDLPYEEKGEVDDIAKANAIDVITLIAPTSKERIRTLAADARGFVYLVSSMGVTGMRREINTNIASLVRDVRSATNIPVAVGFGISNPSQAAQIAGQADGVIVGSAIVKIIEEHGEDAAGPLSRYVASMKAAVRQT